MIKYNEDEIINVCKNSKSMGEAATKLKLHFNTFKRIAKKLNCYITNQGGKGITKNIKHWNKIPLNDILDGKYPEYQTFKLKFRLIQMGIKENKCEICGITSWCGKVLKMELDHINGDRTNHQITNLRMVCPNCHAQTFTYRGKNKSLNREISYIKN